MEENKMTAKEYLQRIRKMDFEIKALKDLAEEQRTKLTRISPVLSDMPGCGGTTDKIPDGLSRLYDVYGELSKKIIEVEKEKDIAYELVASLQDNTHRAILYMRYFSYRSFEEISVSLGYSYRHVCRLHGEALQQFEKMARHVLLSCDNLKA